MAETHQNHGHSVAAWTAVATLMVAAVLIAVGVAWGIHACQIAGVVLVVLGVAAGKILTKAGFGSEPMAAPPAPQQRAVQQRPAEGGRETPAEPAAGATQREDDGPRSTPQTASN